MKRLSIGLRLTIWYLAIFAVAQAVFGLTMWLILRDNLYDIIDDQLEAQIDDATRFLQSQEDTSTAKLREEAAETYTLEHSGDYLQISNAQGEWIYRSPFLEKHELALISPDQLHQPSYTSRKLGGRHFRFLSARVEAKGSPFTVQVGLPSRETLATLVYFQDSLLMLAPFILLVASGVGYWLSRRALAPVDALTRTARAISGNNLSTRLEPLQTGDELQRLSDTLNEMLDRIEAAFRRITEFTADASHELRTPVSLIRTEAELALRRSRNEAEYLESLHHILSEAERTTSLIEELLELARADSGREVLELQPLDLRELTLEAAEKWRKIAGPRDLKLTESVTSEELRVLGDAGALRRLLNILLDNAVKYTPPPGNIELTLEANAGKALLKVKDTGTGIAPEDRAKIFERFYRVDKARSRELGGAGLGLAIAQWIVQQHRGSIYVQSADGKGSVFVVELPLEPVSASASAAEAPLTAPASQAIGK